MVQNMMYGREFRRFRLAVRGAIGVVFLGGVAAFSAPRPESKKAPGAGAMGEGMNPFNETYRLRIRDLCRNYEWARKQRKNILDRCRRWKTMSDSDLRTSVPSQMVPRALYLHRKAGCPECGREVFKHGYYPWRMDPKRHPWKVQCPNCDERFPKNDFLAYYLSGLDENRMFRPERADAALLFNTEHPDPDDPLHLFGVDSGTGYNDKEKGSFKFVAHYNHHANWGANARYPGSGNSVTSAAVGLGYGYAVTGDPVYAQKAAVLLERIADVYPELDFEYWASKGGYHQYRGIYGTAVDSTWSTRVAFDLARAYALVRDSIETDATLSAKIETNILRVTFEKQKQSRIWGNTGFNKEVAMMMALATHDEGLQAELVSWLFCNAEGEPIPSRHSDWRKTRLGGGIGRRTAALTADGFSWEGGFGYSAIMPIFLTQAYPSLLRFAEDSNEESVRLAMQLMRQRLPSFYKTSFQLVCCDRFMPTWGDGGRFGTPMILKGAQQANLFAAYAAFEDADIGRMYWRMAGKKAMPTGDLLNPHIDYERVKERLDAIRRENTPVARSSCNLAGRGFAVMRSGAGEHERSLLAYYGSNTGHNHHESLNLYLFAYGMDLMPGLGYPNISNTTWRQGFWERPIGHNTVATEWDAGPEDLRLADQKLFVVSPLASLTEIDAQRVYPGLRKFSRMPVLVNLSDTEFYVVDFFHIAGGTDHVYSFHSGVGTVALDGARFVQQEGGSYAGKDVPFAVRREGEGWRVGSGMQFLHDVSRATMDGPISAEWQLENFQKVSPFGDDVRLRFTLLNPLCEVALAKSRPPQNIPGNPEDIHYLLARKRTSADEEFVYTSVIEPHLCDRRSVAALRTLETANAGGVASAVEVKLRDGRRDVIVQCTDDSTTTTVEGGIRFAGRLMVARFTADGKLSELLAVRPSHVRIGDAFEEDYTPCVRGNVVALDRGASSTCTITVDGELAVPPEALRPLWTDIRPSPDANGNYRIETVTARDEKTVLEVGNVSFISGFDPETQQYTYAFAEGATLEIPLTYHWKR
ncbi:MAG: hypothetical protein HOJ57_34705 [Lentisphaerae bacterium]|nr:hypothetical protein [Lentisphaerota bacterium]